MFRMARLTVEQLEWWTAAFQSAERTGDDVVVAFDDLDKAIKFKVGSGVWSPPFRTVDAD